ncbi:MAG: isoprenyl transferase [Smithellaceae bacterium]|jgi:undecaprenyl diphosphate synthase|nr:isoprenyl transferase [Smithellaceae bacterium]MDD3258655.1 isoprenyl transferase [Smithellaceae bacterium]MDD3848870.1 isoprenyl transferase [Smithellaceae bacterium]HOG11989.1 isoprenyl transferase [Smithellaceae bacterium]HOQ71194.1 isoprenyl transferase [Smithellaceae bacterium]
MPEIDQNQLPRHIAIIMDGNGRWAKQHAMGRIRGHKKGAQAVRTTVTACRELGISCLTLFAFSSENWGRPGEEVSALMNLLADYLDKEAPTMQKQEIRLTTIGDIDRLYAPVREKLLEVQKLTRQNNKMVLNLALSYGSRDEILAAVKKMLADSREGKLSPDSVDQDVFERYLYTSGMPDPDLLIRTSGEYRISNFLLWQMAYTELYFTDVLWPDFKKDDLLKAIAAYQSRERRFGLTSDQVSGRK